MAKSKTLIGWTILDHDGRPVRYTLDGINYYVFSRCPLIVFASLKKARRVKRAMRKRCLDTVAAWHKEIAARQGADREKAVKMRDEWKQRAAAIRITSVRLEAANE